MFELLNLSDRHQQFFEYAKAQNIPYQIGTYLITNSLYNSEGDILGIAKEFQIITLFYEMFLRSSQDKSVEETSHFTLTTTTDVLAMYRNKIARNEIDLTKFVDLLSTLYQKALYEPSLNRPDSDISAEIDALEQTLKLIKPKLNEKQKIEYYAFLMVFKVALISLKDLKLE